ncbi:MAG: polyprenyl synthetase family protein, partial [Promethearchaeota archaeon]
KINDAIELIFDNKINNVKYQFLKDYYIELKEYFLSGGKRIRPLLCIAAYNAFSSKLNGDIIFPSVGTEFLHNASLIHDDIIDKDDFRRGKPAFHYRFRQYHKKFNLKKMIAEDFGTNLGILGGDSAYFFGLQAYLFNKFEQDLNINAIGYYECVFRELIEGVLIEIAMINQKDIKIDDYIKMISLKTGALIEKSILIGANYAGVNRKYDSLLSTYGINLGIIFQITDDILGTFGDEKITGKPTDGDIREGKKTCLLITALNELPESKKKRLIKLIESSEITEEDVMEVKNLFKEADAINICKQLAKSYYNEAEKSIIQLEPIINPSEAEFFKDLLKFVSKRKF